MRDIKDILTAWRNTRVAHRMGVEYPSNSTPFLGALKSFDYRQYLTEEECQKVDEAVLLLKRIDEKQWAILIAYYLNSLSLRKISHASSFGTTYIEKQLNQAESFVYGHIFSYFFGEDCVDRKTCPVIC